MNDLVHVVRDLGLSAYADGTQTFYAHKEPEKTEKTINNDLARVDTCAKKVV